MKYQINSTGNVIHADQAFMDAQHPVDYTLLPDDVAPVSTDTRITPYHLKRRMTSTERKAIRNLAKTSDDIYDYMDMLDSATTVHLDDPMTIGGLQALEAAGKLAPGRAAAILNAPIQDNERP